jgi:RNA polymerase sigma factor (sigma-70 family)
MVPNSSIPTNNLDEMLAWLNPDREEAAKVYLKLRADLNRIFIWNRCVDPEGLTDEVFDRVGKKVPELRQTYEGDPRLYFYGVARNLVKEYLKKLRTLVSQEVSELPPTPVFKTEPDTADIREVCLQSCLKKLSDDKRNLILNYYAKDKQAKIDHRHEVAQKLGMSVESLRVRAYRIRVTLEQCIERCLDKGTNKK